MVIKPIRLRKLTAILAQNETELKAIKKMTRCETLDLSDIHARLRLRSLGSINNNFLEGSFIIYNTEQTDSLRNLYCEGDFLL